MNCTGIYAFLLSLSYVIAWQETFKYNVISCASNEYFDRDLFKCITCDRNKLLQPNGDGFSCQCMKNSRIINIASNGTLQCEACQANETISADQTVCLPRKCMQRPKGPPACQLCGQNQITITQNTDGSLLKQVQCVKCRGTNKPSYDRTKCVPCPLRSPVNPHIRICSCNSDKEKEVNGICLPKDFLISREEYKPGNHEALWDSGKMMKDLLVSEYLCTKGNTTACHMLANICVMSLYDSQASSPCRFWRAATPLPGIPWLLYSENEAYAILNQKAVNAEYSYKSAGKNTYINLVSAVYSYDAMHFRMEHSIAKWSVLCSCADTLPSERFKFGINYRHKCMVTSKELLQGDQSFFVPYLKYVSNASGTEQLHALPVSIKYKGNEMKSSDGKNNLLYRRFFLLQKCGQLSDNRTCRGDIIAWYLKSFTLKIKIESSKHGKYSGILTPLIQLEYDTLRASQLSHNTRVTLNFAINNEIPGVTLLHDIEISVGVLCGLAILLSLVAAWARCRVRSERPVTMFVATLLMHCCGHFANAFYVVWWGVSLHGLVVVQGQSLLYRLPPTPKEEHLLQSFIIVAFALKTIEMLWVNWRQININIFFLDWEKPLEKTHALSSTEGNFRRSTVAVHWLRLQTVRRVSPPILLAICLLLLEIANLIHLADVESSEAKIARNSKCHALALSAATWVATWLVLHSARALWMMLGRNRGNPWTAFVTLCSLANVSVFVLETDVYGYYVHGRSIHNALSTDIGCGLIPNSSHKNFIILASRQFRMFFTKLMGPMSSCNSKRAPFRNNAASTTDLSPKTESSESVGSTADGVLYHKEPRVQLHNTLNKFLTSFIDHALEDVEYRIRQRGMLERVLWGSELGGDDSRDARSTMFLHDAQDTHHYANVLWWGEEWTLATFDLFLFSFVHCVSGSILVAVFVGIAAWKTASAGAGACAVAGALVTKTRECARTWTVDKVEGLYTYELHSPLPRPRSQSGPAFMEISRHYAGKRNLMRKTLTDDRFII